LKSNSHQNTKYDPDLLQGTTNMCTIALPIRWGFNVCMLILIREIRHQSICQHTTQQSRE